MERVKILPNGTELNVMGGAYGRDEVYDEDIEVVIKIPKYVYDDLHKNKNLPNRLGIEKAITDGTVLPKGHGRLIDADELKKHKYHDNDRYENAVAVAQIDWADTIIEADKEVEK